MGKAVRTAREQFSLNAAAYVTSEIHAKGFDLEFMVAKAGDVGAKRVLDIATGAGHTALAFSAAGGTVTATDISREMLDAAEKNAKEHGAAIRFEPASAEELWYADESFDIVTCRIAPHHFVDPDAFVRESMRVLARGGRFLVVDNISPEDPRTSEAMNRIETIRDPSHVWAYSVKQWCQWIGNHRLELYDFSRWWREKDFIDWTTRSGCTPETAGAIERYIDDLDPESAEYLRVKRSIDGRVISLSHETALFAARKP